MSNRSRKATSALHEHERAVIGLLLCRPSMEQQIFGTIDASMFDDQWARAAFEICAAAVAAGTEIGRGLVMEEMRRRGLGLRETLGPFLDGCSAAGVLTIVSPAEHMNALRDRRFVRSVKTLLAQTEDANEVEAALVEGLGLRLGTTGGGPVPIAALLKELAERQDKVIVGEIVVGYPWGIEELDEHTQLTMGALHTVAALKGAGKSALLLHALRTNARGSKPIPCLAFSLEMKGTHVARRFAAAETGINSRVPDSLYISEEQIARLAQTAADNADTPLLIDDTPNLSVEQIVARTRLWKRRNRIREGIVTIDFAQIVEQHRQRDETGAEALKRAAYAFHTLARTEELAVILAAQFRNEAERESVPRLEFIEGSGGIAQASDVVLGLHLPSRTDRKLSASEGEEKSFEIHILKARHGETGVVVKCMADLAHNRFFGRLDLLQPT